MISKLVHLLAIGSLSIPLVAHGTPTELFFSEYIEGSSNNKALEIYNGTGSAVDLAAGAYSVQMFANGSASAGVTVNLTGSLASGDVFVLAHSSSNASILAVADQTGGGSWYNGDDAVVLRQGAVIIDVIGQIAFDPGTQWGSGLLSTADNTLRRMAPVQAGDANGSDAFDPSLEWIGFATDTFDGLGSHALELSPIPEPATVALVFLALAGMTVRRGRSVRHYPPA
jgi:predicted extracellular nuclease